VGYDPQRSLVDGQGPLAIATTGQLQAIAASILYRRGNSWPDALDRVLEAFQTQERFPLASLIRPAGDVSGVLAGLRRAGVKVAVTTTDHRAETEETLRLLACDHFVDAVVCGDDGIPPKPGPEMLLAVCQDLGVSPKDAAVLGDTAGDMLMALRAGAGLKVGVLTGAGEENTLSAIADVVLRSINEVRVASEG
jgi:phosphoglycolate phosphatase